MKFSEHFRRRYCERFLNLNKFEFKKYSLDKNNIWKLDNELKRMLVFSRKLSVKPESDFGLYVNCRYGVTDFLVNEDKDILFVTSKDKVVTCYKFSEHKKKWKKKDKKETVVERKPVIVKNQLTDYFNSQKETEIFLKYLQILKKQHKIHEIKWLYSYIAHLSSQQIKAKKEQRIIEVAKKYDEMLNQLILVYNKLKKWN